MTPTQERPRESWTRRASDAFAITQPIIVHSRADIASALRSHRYALDMTCDDLDNRAGWADRYTSKLENGDAPQGRRGFAVDPPVTADDPGRITASYMAEIWLESLGLSLVLMPAEMAKAMGAVPAPVKAST